MNEQVDDECNQSADDTRVLHVHDVRVKSSVAREGTSLNQVRDTGDEREQVWSGGDENRDHRARVHPLKKPVRSLGVTSLHHLARKLTRSHEPEITQDDTENWRDQQRTNADDPRSRGDNLLPHQLHRSKKTDGASDDESSLLRRDSTTEVVLFLGPRKRELLHVLLRANNVGGAIRHKRRDSDRCEEDRLRSLGHGSSNDSEHTRKQGEPEKLADRRSF